MQMHLLGFYQENDLPKSSGTNCGTEMYIICPLYTLKPIWMSLSDLEGVIISVNIELDLLY